MAIGAAMTVGAAVRLTFVFGVSGTAELTNQATIRTTDKAGHEGGWEQHQIPPREQ
jgi:hypothetical protein